MNNAIASTVNLVMRAFPSGVPEEMVLAVCRVLYEHLSDRQLALVLASMTGVDEAVALNDVYRAAQLDLNDPIVSAATSALESSGLTDWCDED